MKTPYYDYMFNQALLKQKGDNKNKFILGLCMLSNLKKSRIFKIPNALSQLFLLTDSYFNTEPLPYPNLFLEQKIIIQNKIIIKGILITELDTVYNMDTQLLEKRTGTWICASTFFDDLTHIISFELNKAKLYSNKTRMITTNEITTLPINDLPLKISNIVNSFLCFVNSPDIEYIVKTDSLRDTEIRRRKGKPPRPTIANIILTNPLKRYIYKQEHGEKMVYSHRFWVRGHWRTYQNKRYKNMYGKKQWIKPHIKGEGLLIPKKYELRGE